MAMFRGLGVIKKKRLIEYLTCITFFALLILNIISAAIVSNSILFPIIVGTV